MPRTLSVIKEKGAFLTCLLELISYAEVDNTILIFGHWVKAMK